MSFTVNILQTACALFFHIDTCFVFIAAVVSLENVAVHFSFPNGHNPGSTVKVQRRGVIEALSSKQWVFGIVIISNVMNSCNLVDFTCIFSKLSYALVSVFILTFV